MAEVEEGVFSRLTGFAGLSDLVGTRVYPNKAKQDEDGDSVVYQEVSGNKTQSHDGLSGLDAPRFQFSCYSETAAGARAVRRQVIRALVGFKGTVAGVLLQAGIAENQISRWDEEAKEFRAMIDIRIWYEEETT